MDKERFLDILSKNGQEKFASLFGSLSAKDQKEILAQTDLIDFSMLEGVKDPVGSSVRGRIEPIRTLTIADYDEDIDKYRKVGIDALKKGKVAALMLSGGMGTRLGVKAAKGTVDIGINKPVYIFQRQIENMLDVVREADAWFHVFIMTSDLNDEGTRKFLADHNYFGYDPDYVHFFRQHMAPCLDENGDIKCHSVSYYAGGM